MNVRFTKHAENMLRERRFRKETVENIVQNPDWKEVGEEDIWFAFRKVGKKVIRVVVEGRRKPYTVITMYYDRRLER